MVIVECKFDWFCFKVSYGFGVLVLKWIVRELGLVIVCEEVGCLNLSECWVDGMVMFMILGECCTWVCGFCLVDMSRLFVFEYDEFVWVVEVVICMGLVYAVIMMVVRDDLVDGGAAQVVATIDAVRLVNLECVIEVLISDLKGDRVVLVIVVVVWFDVLNHNFETVVWLQWVVRFFVGYVRSFVVLVVGEVVGFIMKLGLIVGMGEIDDEVEGVLVDLVGVGVDIVIIG